MIASTKRDNQSPEKSSHGGTDIDLDMTANHFDPSVADTELRRRFRQEARDCMHTKGFPEQSKIFMDSIQFISKLVTN